MQSDEQAVRDTDATWIVAVNAGDLDRLHAMMADDVVFIDPGRAAYGRDGFGPGFLEAHRTLHIDCRCDVAEVVVGGDLAYLRSHDTLRIIPKAGGEPQMMAGDRLAIYRKHADGRWRFARGAHTVRPVEENPAST